MLIMHINSTDEDPTLPIESFAIINLHSVSTKLTSKLNLILNVHLH